MLLGNSSDFIAENGDNNSNSSYTSRQNSGYSLKRNRKFYLYIKNNPFMNQDIKIIPNMSWLYLELAIFGWVYGYI